MTRRLPLLAILLSIGFAGCTGSIAQAQGDLARAYCLDFDV